MAHDEDDDASLFDTQDSAEDQATLWHAKQPKDVMMSPISPSEAPLRPCSPDTIGRSKAVSAAAVPNTLSVSTQYTDECNETLHGLFDAQRRTQSESNLRIQGSSAGLSLSVNSAAPAAYLASPAHSESALQTRESASPPPVLSVRLAADTRPSGFMALGGNLLAGVADFAGLKSPRSSMQKVQVVYPTSGPLYVDLYSRDDGTGARVRGFRRKADGLMAYTEASGRVSPGDELVAINAVDVTKMMFSDIIAAAKIATFPLTLTYQCDARNREDDEKDKILASKLSSGPLPPMSPSSCAGWGARLNQMTRSGSFDQTTSGLGLSSESSCQSPTFEPQGGKFGFSLGTDGVKKNIFRMIGSKPGRPEEDETVVQGWIDNLALKPHTRSSGGRHRPVPESTNPDVLHSTPIVAVTTGGRFVGVLDDDQKEFELTWFRKFPSETEIRQVKGVTQCPYFPSVDDVGAILCLQCTSLRFARLKRIVELPRPLILDPAVGKTVEVLLEAGAGSFSATLASNEHDSFQLKIAANAVTLVKISEDDEDGGVVVTAAYSAFVQVLLDPANQVRFTLKVQEFGGFLGHCPGDVCDVKKHQTQFESLSCVFLVAPDRQTRDILTLLIRTCRARVISWQAEREAQRDERNLYMDPAFVEAASSLPLTASGYETACCAESLTVPTRMAVGTRARPSSVWTGKPRFQRDGSVGSDSSARLSDLVGFVPEELGDVSNEQSLEGLTTVGTTMVHDSRFIEGRLAAQDNEMAMLREKLAAVTVLLKVAEQENQQLVASLEVKDNRIERQQQQLRQLEKLSAQCSAQSREIVSLRLKFEDEERRHVQEGLEGATQRAFERQDQMVQTEAQLFGTRDVQQQIQEQQVCLAKLQDEHVQVVTDRNRFRATSLELSKELRRVIKANDNRPLDDLVTQLAARRTLEVDFVAVKTEAQKTANELKKLKRLLASGDKDRGSKGLAAQRVALQRKVHQLQDSLSEARDQVEAMKRINAALATRLHRLQPETLGSILGFSEGEDGEDDGRDDEEEEEDAELTDGIAAFRRSLVGE